LSELTNDISIYEGFSTKTRDLNACLSYLLESIESSIYIQADKVKHKRRNNLRFEVECLSRAMNNNADNLVERSNSALQNFLVKVNQKQAENTKGLTVFAAIFLPISLARSLLSMSTHAVDLGSLWYD
jgi:hypothetical protein